MQKNDQRRNKYIVPGRNKSYFVEDHTDSNWSFFETDIIKMLWLMGGVVFQQTAVILVGPNCLPLHRTWFFSFWSNIHKIQRWRCSPGHIIWKQISFLLSQKMVCYYNLFSSLVWRTRLIKNESNSMRWWKLCTRPACLRWYHTLQIKFDLLV